MHATSRDLPKITLETRIQSMSPMQGTWTLILDTSPEALQSIGYQEVRREMKMGRLEHPSDISDIKYQLKQVQINHLTEIFMNTL